MNLNEQRKTFGFIIILIVITLFLYIFYQQEFFIDHRTKIKYFIEMEKMAKATARQISSKPHIKECPELPNIAKNYYHGHKKNISYLKKML